MIFTVNDGLGLGVLLLLFPQGLGGFQFVDLLKHNEPASDCSVTAVTALRRRLVKKLTSVLFHWLTDGTRRRRIQSRFK